MSVWEEKSDDVPAAQDRSTMCDVVFKIACPQLPVDHAAELTSAVCTTIPWIKSLTGSGIIPIHVAGSQNGWQRPELSSQEPLILSKRTRLRVRCPVDQNEDLITSLTNAEYTIGGYPLRILEGKTLPLQRTATLFARYVVYSKCTDDESDFIQNVIAECSALGFQPTKLLCGRSNTVTTPAGKLQAKSLLIDDVPPEYSLPLQEKGLGEFRLMGCGVLIPHKGTDAVR